MAFFRKLLAFLLEYPLHALLVCSVSFNVWLLHHKLSDTEALGFMGKLKDFLADRPEAAFLACSVTANLWLFRELMKAKDEHLSTALMLAPIADKLTGMVQKAAARSRQTRSGPPPEPLPTGTEDP